MTRATLIVVAKAPFPGRSKTRLCPPCSPEQAAALATAALQDTLAAVAAVPDVRRVLALDRSTGGTVAVPEGFEVLDQRGDGLDERLAAAFEDVGGPALLVGMDTPQVTPELLASSWAALEAPGVDAVLGDAPDGGYWAVGLRRPRNAHFVGVPMSSGSTSRRQRERFAAEGLDTVSLPVLRDVDDIADAEAVAAAAPRGAFARTLRALGPDERSPAPRGDRAVGGVAP